MSGDVGLPDGFVLCALDSVASTNDEARGRAEAGASGGLVITAREQTEGRGRYGRSWASPPGHLYASVLLRPDCAMAATTQLSLLAGLALAGALEGLGPPGLDLKLKWPNDVLIGGAKVAGLLLEGTARPDGRAAWVLVGSGINVASYPDGTPYPATSLREAGFAEVAP
ncbi:MAG: biotin--[acetyl-CoA-carboxylase] ligase, partial [Geminicoccales bacterium]